MGSRFVYWGVFVLLGLLLVLRVSLSSNVYVIPRGQDVVFEATIKEEPKITDKWQVVSISSSRIYLDRHPRYKVGDRIIIEGKVNEEGLIFRPKVRIIGHNSNWQAGLSSLRLKLTENIFRLLPAREATLVSGMVLGIDSIDEGFREALISTGTIHVVVVSGQNLAIVAGIFTALSAYIGRRFALFLSSFAVFLYAALTGFNPPVVRASLMVLSSSVAVFLGREMWPVWSLMLAAFVILMISPSSLWEISFQLTFAATFGIITLGKYLQTLLKKLPILGAGAIKTSFLIVGQNVAIATSAYIFTAPLIIFYFGTVSPIAPVVNVFVAELVAPIMILGFVISLTSLASMSLAQVIAYLAYAPAFLFVSIVEIFSHAT